MQAIIQLALLSFCPTGTKLSISNNLLDIQTPNWTQGVIRSYNYDKRDDLVFLFSVINRFTKFYSYLCDDSNTNQLYNLLVELGKEGLSKIVQTYSGSSDAHLLQTLRMYQTLLDKPDEKLDIQSDSSNENTKEDIDEVFIRIRDIYRREHIIIIYNLLKLLQQNPDDYRFYIDSMNNMLSPTNLNIQKWINDNIIF